MAEQLLARELQIPLEEETIGLFLTVVSQLSGAQASDGLQAGRGMLALGIVLLTVGGASDYLIVTVRYWHALVAYAHTGHLLGLQQTTQAPGLAANESYSA